MNFRPKAIKTDRASTPLVDLDTAVVVGTEWEVHTSGGKGHEDLQDDFKATHGFERSTKV